MDDVMTPESAQEAAERALSVLRHMTGGGVVALSGGCDSALLLHLAAEAWGPEHCLAVTSRSESLPEEELSAARGQAGGADVEHVRLDGGELDIEAFRRNGPDRCFHCKDHLYREMRALADARGLAHVIDGTNADDTGDHRPGLAAAQRHHVRSPLQEAGLTKADVRAVSKLRGLPTWDKPAEACLSSRVPYGTPVTADVLAKVERAERALKALGFGTVRVRVHGDVGKIEVPPDEVAALVAPGMRERAIAAVKDAGFAYAAIDLEGFRSGALNEKLRSP